VNLSIIFLTFGVIFIGELPDKSMFASLVLSTRFNRFHVWLGAAAALLAQVAIAVTAGRLLALLPHRPLELIVGSLFLIGGLLLSLGKNEDESQEQKKVDTEKPNTKNSFIKVFTTAFVIVFLGEWGDITQIATANYAARYHDPLSVGVGAVIALWAVSGLGVLFGSKLLKRIPGRILQRATAVILFIFAALSFVAAIR
jgi:putative Ca2+/H+ antiporter (TMEM165/GDT1 family)